MKSKLKIIIPIAIAVTAIILAVIFIQFKPNEAQLSDNPFELAQNYLVEQSYEQAIAEFEKAIALDPMNVEAYIGIAEAYEAVGNKDMAVQWLEKGFEATGDERLQSHIADQQTHGHGQSHAKPHFPGFGEEQEQSGQNHPEDAGFTEEGDERHELVHEDRLHVGLDPFQDGQVKGHRTGI